MRRYLLAKQAWIRRHTEAKHTLLVPGDQDTGPTGGVVTFASPALRAGYRCPVRLGRLRSRLKDLRPSILEAGDPYTMAWQVARAADELRIPAVAFCHSDVIELARRHLGGVAERATTAYLRRLYARFQRVLAPSRYVAGRLHEAGIDHVVVQPLGVDPMVFSPARAQRDLRARLGLPAHTRLLVFAGRLAPEKNVDELFELADLLGNPFHLVVIGGERPCRPGPRVTVLPYEPDALRLAALLASCDTFVHAGRNETFGLVALEAMACGLPVVTYEGGALAELLDSRVGALAPCHGPPALAEAVAGLFTRDLGALGIKARNRVLERYTWDTTLDAQMRLYSHLEGGPTVVIGARDACGRLTA